MATQEPQLPSTMSKRNHEDNKEKDEDFKVIFVDTSLDTRFTVVASPLESISILQERIVMEHLKLFPNFGKIELSTLTVKLDGTYCHICVSVSMKLRMLFRTIEDVFLFADVADIRKKNKKKKRKTQHFPPNAEDLWKMEDVVSHIMPCKVVETSFVGKGKKGKRDVDSETVEDISESQGKRSIDDGIEKTHSVKLSVGHELLRNDVVAFDDETINTEKESGGTNVVGGVNETDVAPSKTSVSKKIAKKIAEAGKISKTSKAKKVESPLAEKHGEDTRVVQVNQRCCVSGSEYSYAVTNTVVDGPKNTETNDKEVDGVHESHEEGKKTVDQEVREPKGVSEKIKRHETKISVPEKLNLPCRNNGDQELASDSRQEMSELLKPVDVNISKPKEMVTDDRSQVHTEIPAQPLLSPVLSNAPEKMTVDKPKASTKKSKKTKQNERTSQVIANVMNDNLKQDRSKNPEDDIECSSVILKKTCKRKLIFPTTDEAVTEKCYDSERTRSAGHQGNADEAHPTDVFFDKLGQLVSDYQAKDDGNEDNEDEIVPESPISSTK